MSEKVVALSSPVTIGSVEAISLKIETRFQIGWLRNAPPTPDWFIGVVKFVVAKLPWTDIERLKNIRDQELVALVSDGFPAPTGVEVSAMVPWLLHIAEKASGQPPSVVDQLGIGDLATIIFALLPGMISLANFRQTSANGAATLPGSSTGTLTPSTA